MSSSFSLFGVRFNLPRPIRLPSHAHDRRQNRRAMLFHSTLANAHIRQTNRQHLPRPHHPRPGHQLIPIRRREQIYLVLHGQNRSIRRHQSISRIPASTVGHRSRHTRMKKSMLLRQFRPKRHTYLRPTRAQRHQFRPKMLHQPLPRKTIPHAALILRILRFKCRFFFHAREYNSAPWIPLGENTDQPNSFAA